MRKFIMKKIISLIICIALLVSCLAISAVNTASADNAADFSLSGVEFTTQKLKTGWNLGNTLEADADKLGDSFTPQQVETAWWNPVTTHRMIDFIASSGFNFIRIPITWKDWIDDDNNFAISEAWINRIKEIVGYAYDNNMYVIINVHHDDGKDRWLDISKKGDEFERVKTKLEGVWTNIANAFKDYDEHLIFEGMNEPIDRNKGDWYGHEQYYFDNLNVLYKVFVDAVRATGGNNAKRYLMIPTYGAQVRDYQVSKVIIPNSDKNVLIDVHKYDGSTTEDSFDWWMKSLKTTFIDKGYGVVIGETGVDTKLDDNRKVAWVNAYYTTAQKYSLPIAIWDDGGNLKVLDRSNRTWISQPEIDAIMSIIYKGEIIPTETIVPTTTAAPVVTTENDGQYEASDTVYYGWTTSFYQKTEGWQSDANNLNPAYPTVEDGVCKWDLSGFNSQQINSSWQISYTKDMPGAKAALKTANETTHKLFFTIKVISAKNSKGKSTAIKLKHSLCTGTSSESNLIKINEGETKEIVVDVTGITTPQSTFTMYYQQFDEGLTEFKAEVSSITVAKLKSEPIAYGDCNSDGKIDAKDMLLIRKYLSKWNVEIDKEAADCNVDGKIDSKDMLLLRKYLAKWEVTLGK